MSELSPAAQASAARKSSGLFHLDRGLIEIRGGDRVRWLNGMISNEVAGLGQGAGCYALLLTRQGRIVADFHVLAHADSLWLETAPAAVSGALEAFEKFVVADDVELVDRSSEVQRLGLEGPSSMRIVASLTGGALELAANAFAELEIRGVRVLVAAYGFGGGPALQLIFPPPGEEKKEKIMALISALEAAGSPQMDPEALEILRIEGGVPAFGSEIGEKVLPAEARLQNAISITKGCYTGQEVVERMRSRDRLGHLMVGLACSEKPLEPGAAVHAPGGEEGKRIGRVTSSCVSEGAGPIALGFVRAAHSALGTTLSVAGQRVEVVALPFVDVAVPALS